MLRSAFTAFFRSFTRHPLYALLNLLGLSFGIAVFLVLGLYVRFETSFDAFWPEARQIYIASTTYNFPNEPEDKEIATMGGFLDQLKEDYPQLVGTRIWGNDVTIHRGSVVTREAANLVDPSFFQVFDLKLTQGDRATALASPQNVILSEEMADKYFHGKPALGETLRLTDGMGTLDYRVTGIFKTLPKNTDFESQILMPLMPARMVKEGTWRHWGSIQLFTFLKMTPDAEQKLAQAMPAFIDRKAEGDINGQKWSNFMHMRFQPITTVHLDELKDRTAVYAMGLVGILAFLIAAINYINLATARAGMRAKEVAVRKSLGATTGALRTQFLIESVFVTLLATLIGLSIVELTLPLINSFGGLTLKLDYTQDGIVLAGLALAILLVGLLAGIYPALVLSGFKPAAVLAASRSPSGGRAAIRIREGLVVIQFGVVVAFFILVIGFYAQVNHIKTADVGFKRDGLLITSAATDAAVSPAQASAYWQALRAQPGIVSVTVSDSAPGDESSTSRTNVAPEGFKGANQPNLTWTVTGPDYFTTYGARLVAGRFLDAAHGGDQKVTKRVEAANETKPANEANTDGVTNVVLNEGAVKVMGFKSPQAAIGQILNYGDDTKVRVVGVVANIRFRSPKAPVPAMLYFFKETPTHDTITGVRYAGVSEPVMRARMETVWRQIAPDVPFKAISAVDNLDKYYKPERNRSNLFSMGALIAALIGCIGLYGMAAFNTSRRAREIGLRKVLGASGGQVVRLLVGQFLRPVLLANLIAWPLAYLSLKNWLSQFDDAIQLNIGYFLAASALAMLIALVTVAGLAFMSASTEPGKALRHE